MPEYRSNKTTHHPKITSITGGGDKEEEEEFT
jgi:hypothetical protein